jgi:hypothetical protein
MIADHDQYLKHQHDQDVLNSIIHVHVRESDNVVKPKHT